MSDRRVRYTKEMLNQSLIELLETKPISRVTVTELCRNADINRSTYYTHFTDPYNQLQTLKQDFSDKLNDIISDSKDPTSFPTILKVCEFIKANKKTFLVLNNNIGYLNTFEMLYSEELVYSIWNKQGNRYSEQEQKYVFAHSSAGTISVLCKWLREDENVISSEEIASLLLRIDTSGIVG